MRSRFTLPKLMLVVAVIAILAGMLKAALVGAQNNDKRVRTRAKITSLMIAIANYHTTHNMLPMESTIDDDRLLNSAEYTTLLSCVTVDSALPELDPRGVRVTASTDAAWHGAWSRDFRVAMDFDYDGEVADSAIHGYNTGGLATNAAIWSKGRDQADNPIDSAQDTSDNVASWRR